MKHLIESGLRFGDLLHVQDAHLIARYNQALTAFGLPVTQLNDFYIDISGYSAEIGVELNNPHYLDPRGVNQRFIILSPQQRDLPLISSMFSASKGLFHEFFTHNRRMIDAITLRDCLYGEIENLIYDVKVPADLLTISKIEFLLHTPGNMLDDVMTLNREINHFTSSCYSWRNTDLMRSIVRGAKRCGDIRNNGLMPSRLTIDWPAVVHTGHFGGAFIFRNASERIVFVGDEAKLQPLPDHASFIDQKDVDGVLALLRADNYIEPFNLEWLRESGILDHRLKLLLAEILCACVDDFDPQPLVTTDYINPLIIRYIDLLQPHADFRAISEMRSLFTRQGDPERYLESLKPQQQLLFLRALPEVAEADKINLIMSRHLSFDFLSHYILDKQAFYDQYAQMDKRMQSFAVAYLTHHYAPPTTDRWRRKASVRETLFGRH